MAKPVSPKPAPKAPVTLAPVKAFAAPGAAVGAAPETPAAKNPAAKNPATKAPAPAPVAAEQKAASGKTAAGKPTAVKSKAAASSPVPTKPAATKSAETPATASTVVEAAVRASDQTLATTATPEVKQIAKPATEAGAAVARTVAATVDTAVTETAKIAEEAGKAAARNIEALASAAAQVVETAPTTSALPKPPEAVALAGSALLEQTLVFARLMGNLQAQMLDHACAELKANLATAETLARADSASEAIKLQAAAVRRGYEAGAAHLTELTRTAQSALKR